MDLLKKAFTTPVKGKETNRHQISPETALGGAPPEQQGKQKQPSSGTLPATDAAVLALQGFKHNPNQPPAPGLLPTTTPQQHIMFSLPPPRTLTPLETEEWPCPKNASPNPVSINRAREFLSAGMGEEDCELPGADVHSCAWMVKNDAKWFAQAGAGKASMPKRLPLTDDQSPACCRKKDLHRVHMHMVLEGKKKLIECLESRCSWTCM